jgi:class 3 adenylate cyclase
MGRFLDFDSGSPNVAHDAVVRSQLARFGGREVNPSGDGFLAMFDGPQRAIRCAMSIRDALQALGIEVRVGLHTGEDPHRNSRSCAEYVCPLPVTVTAVPRALKILPP